MLETIDLTQEFNKENENVVNSNTFNLEEESPNDNKTKTSQQSKSKIEDGEHLFSPPKKKLKQEYLSFQKISKDEAFKEITKELNENTETENKKYAKGKSDMEIDVVEASDVVNGNNYVANGENKSPISNKPIEPVPCSTPVVSTKEEVQTVHTPDCSAPIVTTKEEAVEVNTPNIKSPKIVLSKEERKKRKEQKEQEKMLKLKELEEKKLKREEEKKKREQEKLQKQVEKEAEKERREQERKEKERMKEEERKKKEEERKAKELEKKKRDELKEVEREKREVERKAKEAEKERKENEKRLEEEKKRLEEEAIRKKKEKAANQFISFFTKKENRPVIEGPVEEIFVRFKPFQVKPGMTLAPLLRKSDFQRERVDKCLEEDTLESTTYLLELSRNRKENIKNKYTSRRSLRRKEHEEKKQKNILNNPPRKENVICIDDDDEEEEEINDSFEEANTSHLYTAKLLQFSENTRPAYYGTWRKTTNKINGRKIHGLDTEIFSYDVDSDEEWIDEPGESLSGDDAEEGDEKDDIETEDDNDGFFVPHGYLSDDEGVQDSEEENENESDERETLSDANKARRDSHAREQDKLKVKVSSFEADMKKQFKPRKPICLGIIYTNIKEKVHPILCGYEKVHLFKTADEKNDEDLEDSPTGRTIISKIPSNNIPEDVPEEAMPFLIKFLHGNTDGLKKLVPIFRSFWSHHVKLNELESRPNISKRQLLKKIQEITSRNYNEKLGKVCYTVSEHILQKYEIENKVGLNESNPVSDFSMHNTPVAINATPPVHSEGRLAKLNNDRNGDTPMHIALK